MWRDWLERMEEEGVRKERYEILEPKNKND